MSAAGKTGQEWECVARAAAADGNSRDSAMAWKMAALAWNREDSDEAHHTCETCRWWASRRCPGRTDDGECHKRAPIVIIEGEAAGQDAWPQTKAHNFCGDWAPKLLTAGEGEA